MMPPVSCCAWALPYGDVLLRRLMLRFVLYRAVVASASLRPELQPGVFPPLPPCVDAAAVAHGVAALAKALGAGAGGGAADGGGKAWRAHE